MNTLRPDVLWMPFSRSSLKGTYRLAGLTCMFLTLALSVAACAAVWNVGTVSIGVSGVSRIAKALGLADSERILDGHDPSTPAQLDPAQARAGGPAAEGEIATALLQVPADTVTALPAEGASSPAAAGDRMQIVNTDGLGVVLRTAPRDDARVPRGLAEGTRVTVLGRDGENWVLVRGDNRAEGWVPGQYLTPSN
jgi:uncharacterized protein YgiM (DUF1202 family)